MFPYVALSYYLFAYVYYFLWLRGFGIFFSLICYFMIVFCKVSVDLPPMDKIRALDSDRILPTTGQPLKAAKIKLRQALIWGEIPEPSCPWAPVRQPGLGFFCNGSQPCCILESPRALPSVIV